MTTDAPNAELARTYRPADVEPEVLERWLAAKAYHAEPAATAEAGKEPYAIVIPPPNVTAALHLGHALNNTLQDVLTRYHRMAGRNAVWLPGTDHAGIATQTVVEKRVRQEEGKTRADYAKEAGGREKFVQKIHAWKDEYEAFITNQLKTMGCSCDWDRQRFTMDEVCTRAVREAFFNLFKDGLIYRGKRLVNWDPVTQTALADDEVEMQEVDGNFWYMKYPLVDDAGNATGEHVTVATTRPETMLGDTAVAVNPKDPERAKFIGHKVRLPIVGRVIPVIGDDYVVIPDPDSSDAKAKYASGFLKVTPAHDPNDYEIGQRHELALINVMAPDASVSLDHGWAQQEPEQRDNAELAPLLGLSREEARKAVVKFFKQHDLLAEVRPYRHSVGHSYRSHVPVEPYLSDQWYVGVRTQIASLPDEGAVPGTDLPANSLAGLALRAMAEDQRTGEVAQRTTNGHKPWEGHLRFYPDRYAKTFQTWHENIRDWCISRQLWWGHRIPVWTKEGPEIPASIELPQESNSDDLTWVGAEVKPDFRTKVTIQGRYDSVRRVGIAYACVAPDNLEIEDFLRNNGWKQDPDVLDTWFSSALWPLSTMGWPQDTPELRTWNPTNVLCTAREIITLWVSRMVMFNLYFRDKVPFHDVFIHAMIQDGQGQKMSKSLGNGVDPMDIIHSHGADAMRFTLAQMTTHTQDVRMPVDMICPYTGETFEPKTIRTSAGHVVAAPVQECPTDPSKKMVSSFGVASGQVAPTKEMPLARNTSTKFDNGRNFSNKLWNAVRFALTSLEAEQPDETPAAVDVESLTLPDRWILSRLARTVQTVDHALRNYEFNVYAQSLYDFFWRDLCDWYIEAVKPTVRSNPAQRAVLAASIDASLRMLHPVMPFITEKLWTHLNAAVPQRGLPDVTLPASEMLMTAAWPKVAKTLVDESVEERFDLVQRVVSALRQTRTQYTVPPRQTVALTAKAPPAIAQRLLDKQALIEALANVEGREIGPRVDRPADAAVAVTGDIELYLHGLIDTDTERQRLTKRAAELANHVQTLQKRLSNESYVTKAPAHLVQETRDQLAAAEREAESVREQLDALG